MSRSLEILITETAEELKNQLHSQREGRTKERIQALYWLKTGQAETALEVASLIGKSYSTVKSWLRIYRRDGLKQMKEVTHGGGRTLSVPPEILEQLNGRLKQREGFSGYEEIQAWLKEIYGLEIGYKTLYGIVHARLKARPKVVRPQSAARDESKASEFEKKRVAIRYNGYSISY